MLSSRDGRGVTWRGHCRTRNGLAWLPAVAIGICFWLLWLPQAAFAWSLNVPPGTPTVNTPIGMWYLHPNINIQPDGDYSIPIDSAAKRNQLTQFGFASVGGAPLTNEGSIVMDDGVNYVIQSTAHLKGKGLGFVLQFRTRVVSFSGPGPQPAANFNDWTPVTRVTGNPVCPASWLSIPNTYTNQRQLRVNMDIRIHWIRLAGLNTGGGPIDVASGSDNTRIFNVRLMTGVNGGCTNVNNSQTVSQFWQAVQTYRAPVQSCTTPPGEQLVNFATHFQSEFTGIGSTTAPQNFQFTVHCPEGYNAIRFWVGSPYRVASDPDGVIRLNPDSAASGFGVKIWDGQESSAQPLKFGAENTYLVPGYTVYKGLHLDPSQPTGDNRAAATQQDLWGRTSQPAQDYTIALKAALVQTAPTITPGAFHTHILIYLVYK